MIFFFKEKPIEIIAVVPPQHEVICKLNPIKPARECFPSWWKSTPSSSFSWDTLTSNRTIKSCPGIGLSLQRGFILPLWSDLAVESEGDKIRWQFSDRMSEIELHNNDSTPNFYVDHHILKVASPWRFITPIDLFACFPFYLFNTPVQYTTPSGFVPPLLNSCALNPFIFIKKTEQRLQLMLKNNTPLLQIIPFTDKKVKFKCEVVSREEYTKIDNRLTRDSHFTQVGLKNMFFSKQQEKING